MVRLTPNSNGVEKYVASVTSDLTYAHSITFSPFKPRSNYIFGTIKYNKNQTKIVNKA